jgi:hypothetical protein
MDICSITDSLTIYSSKVAVGDSDTLFDSLLIGLEAFGFLLDTSKSCSGRSICTSSIGFIKVD